jgi:hypothetical protein
MIRESRARVEWVELVVIGPAKEERDISEISSLTVNLNPSPQGRAHNREAGEFKEKGPAT